MINMRSQSGAVLLVALVLLLILTVAGISAVQISSVEEKMTGNFNDRSVAIQVAEAMLVEAEILLSEKNYQAVNFWAECDPTTNECFKPSCSDGLCFTGSYSSTTPSVCTPGLATSPLNEQYQQKAIWNTASTHRTAVLDIGLDDDGTPIGIEGKYIIEFMCYVVQDPSNPGASIGNNYSPTYWEPFYRITALGYGKQNSTRVMLQSTFRRN